MLEKEKGVLYQLIGKKISWYLSNVKNVKQVDLAKRLGVSRATLSNVLSGKRQISIHLLVDISKELNIEPSALFPSVEDINAEILSSSVQIDKILEKEGISSQTQAAILNLINNPQKNK